MIGAFYSTCNELGFGFLESVYGSAFAIQLESCGLFVRRQHPIIVNFRGRVVGEFRADLLVEEVLLVEIKSAKSLVPMHEAQLLNYLPDGVLNPISSIRVHPCSSVARKHVR